MLKSVELDNKNKPAMWVLIQIYTELPQLLGGSKSLALQYANELEEMSLIDGLFAKKYIKKVHAKSPVSGDLGPERNFFAYF